MRKEQLKKLIYPQNQGFILVLLLSITLFSCDKLIDVKEVDTKGWKKDFEGCTDLRQKAAKIIVAKQAKLIGKHENTIVQFLGHPNQLDLGKKMTRTAYYTIINENCVKGEAQKVMVIDYNSLSQVRMIMIEDQQLRPLSHKK